MTLRLITAFLLIMTTSMLADTPRKVTLQLKWKHQFQFAGYYMAKEKGYYKEAGLDVSFIEYSSGDPLQIVLNKQADFAIHGSSVVYERVKGTPIKALLAVFQHSPIVIVGLKEMDQKSKQYTVEVPDYRMASTPVKLMLKQFGKKINIKPTTFRMDSLIKGESDFIDGYITNQPYQLKQLGLSPVIYNPRDFNIDFYDDFLVTSEKLALEDPDLVQKFIQASSAGWKYALGHIDQTIDVIMRDYNTQGKTKESLYYEAQMSIPLIEIKNFGDIDLSRLKQTIMNQSNFFSHSFDMSKLDDFVFTPPKKLNEVEKAYVESRRFTLCLQSDQDMFDHYENGNFTGVMSEIFQEISNFSGLKYDIIQSKDYFDLNKMVTDETCDMVSIMGEQQTRFENMIASNAFHRGNLVTISNLQATFDSSLKNMDQHHYITLFPPFKRIFEERYPDVTVELVPDHAKAAKKLFEDHTVHLVLPKFLAINFMQNQGYDKLRVNTRLDDLGENYVIGVIDKEAELLDVVNKAILNFKKGFVEEIMDKHTIHRYYSANNTWLWYLLFFLVVLLIVSLYKFYTQKKEHLEEERKLNIILQQQSKLAAMGEMVGAIAHQWRQPLNEVGIRIQKVKREFNKNRLDEKYIESFVKENMQTIQFMSDTIDNFRNFFRIDKETNSFDIKQAIEEVVDMLNAQLKHHNIEVDVQLHAQEVIGYPNEFKQVIINIITNAKDVFLDNDISSPVIKITNKDEILSIQDNAGGIQETVIDRIFEPYFTTKEQGKGTGLGLYLSKIIIEENMHGQMMVHNTEDGAVFTISFEQHKA